MEQPTGFPSQSAANEPLKTEETKLLTFCDPAKHFTQTQVAIGTFTNKKENERNCRRYTKCSRNVPMSL
jgi:hypothetical protein